MLRKLSVSALFACATVFANVPASAQSAPDITLARLDCGTQVMNDISGRFTDTFAYPGRKLPFTFSCYLIRHGDEYMLWDTGHSMSAGAPAPKVSIVDQLAQLKLKPEQIKYIGISHYHADHTGQLPSFPAATLLIGKGDWDGITATPPNAGANVAAFGHWVKSGGKLEALTGDKDVFGDGSVVILRTPGHTPGHNSVLVRLKEAGNFLLTGDLAHFRENFESNGVPAFNFHRGDTVMSLERFKKAADNLKAIVVIQHDPRDIGKLPVFPAAAR
jgi:glyoxylase-like metal-dependent hydrolase (beta-lactamase superfamily II)